MNTRLAELYSTAAEYAFDLRFVAGVPRPLNEVINEKFADLVVAECAKIAEDCYTYHRPLSTVPDYIRRFERLTDENV